MTAPDPTTQTSFIVVDAAGHITMRASMPYGMIAQQPIPSGSSVMLGDGHWDTEYVSNGIITPRPANPSTISGMTISKVPNPSSVTIGTAAPQTVIDGVVNLSFTQPGTYKIVVSSWPALDANFTVTQP